MKRNAIRLAFLALIVAALAVIMISGADEKLSFENLKENRKLLEAFVQTHYVRSVLLFMALYLSTAFFVPGAVVMTLAAGVLFGVMPGALYVNLAAAIGAVAAFWASRYVFGELIQQRYGRELESFNREIARHGHYYLITLRIIPVLPFFLVNYLAGMTKMPLGRFLWTSVAGILPGSVAYTFAGEQIGSIESPGDALSAKPMAALALLALFSLLPVLRDFRGYIKRKMRR